MGARAFVPALGRPSPQPLDDRANLLGVSRCPAGAGERDAWALEVVEREGESLLDLRSALGETRGDLGSPHLRVRDACDRHGQECRVADPLGSLTGQLTNGVEALTGGPDPALVDPYEQSWTHRALQLQEDLGADLPLGEFHVVSTHNSFNTIHSPLPGVAELDPNQVYGLRDQLRMDVRHLELDTHGQHEFRGVGEGGAIAAPAALVAAIEDALSPFDVRIDDQHLPPWRICELVDARRAS